MNKYLDAFKLSATAIFSFIAGQLGGADSVLSLLTTLIICDIATGLIYAVMTKTVSSREMRNGVVRKLLVFVVIFIAFKVDKCIIDIGGAPIQLFGKAVYVRTLFIIYSCIEEGLSLLENLANIGVPFPKWLRTVLKQVSDCANSSTPKMVVAWLKKTFGIEVKEDKKPDESSEEKSEDEVDKG